MGSLKETKKLCEELYKHLDKHFEYGIAKDGKLKTHVSNKDIAKYYRFQSPDEFEQNGGGICFDYVEYEEAWLKERDVSCRKFYLITETPPDYDTHTFVVIETEGKFIWVESSMKNSQGVHIFSKLRDLLKMAAWGCFRGSRNKEHLNGVKYSVFEYTNSHPKYGCEIGEYMDWMIEHGKWVFDDMTKKEQPQIVEESDVLDFNYDYEIEYLLESYFMESGKVKQTNVPHNGYDNGVNQVSTWDRIKNWISRMINQISANYQNKQVQQLTQRALQLNYSKIALDKINFESIMISLQQAPHVENADRYSKFDPSKGAEYQKLIEQDQQVLAKYKQLEAVSTQNRPRDVYSKQQIDQVIQQYTKMIGPCYKALTSTNQFIKDQQQQLNPNVQQSPAFQQYVRYITIELQLQLKGSTLYINLLKDIINTASTSPTRPMKESFLESDFDDVYQEAAAFSRRGVSGWRHTDATYEEKKNFERAMSFNSEIVYLRKEMNHMTKREIVQRLASLYNKLAEIYDNIEEDYTEVPIKTSRLGFARKPEKRSMSHRQYIDRLIYEIRDNIIDLNRNFNRGGVKIVIQKMMDVWEYEKRELHINDHIGDKLVGNLTEKASHKILDKIMDSYVDKFYDNESADDVYQEEVQTPPDRTKVIQDYQKDINKAVVDYQKLWEKTLMTLHQMKKVGGEPFQKMYDQLHDRRDQFIDDLKQTLPPGHLEKNKEPSWIKNIRTNTNMRFKLVKTAIDAFDSSPGMVKLVPLYQAFRMLFISMIEVCDFVPGVSIKVKLPYIPKINIHLASMTEPITSWDQVYQEAKLSTDDRNDLDDSQFGIPELRKYPLTDEKHVLQAVRFFNKAPDEYKEELAKNIVKRVKELGMDWENWESLKPYLDKKVQEAYHPIQTTHPNATNHDKIYEVKDLKYDKVYFGTPNEYKDGIDCDRPLFVTPFKSLACIFAVSKNKEELGIPHGRFNYHYDEWAHPKNEYIDEIHMQVEGLNDETEHTKDMSGYVYEVDISDLKDHIGKYDWMSPHREYLIYDIDHIDWSNQKKVDVKVHWTGQHSDDPKYHPYQEADYHDKCISYAMGVDDSIYDLKDKGFEIEEDDGNYCVTFDWSKRKIWEKYIESHIQDTYWNEYIRLSDITIHFMINENGKIQHVINHNYEEDDELLSTCNRLCEGSFKTIKSLIFSNDFYKKELKNRKIVQEAVDINSLRQQCQEVFQQASQIHYGCLDENGERITASPFKDSWKMISTYHSQSIQSMEQSKLGVCFEHSFYVAKLLKDRGLPCQTFFLNCNIDHTQPPEEDEDTSIQQESESIAVEQHNNNDMSFWHQFTIVPNDTDSIVLIETSLTHEKNGVFLVENMDDVVSHLIQTFDLHLSQEDLQLMKQDLIDVSSFEPRDGDTYVGYINQVYLNGKFIKNEIRINHQTKTMKTYWQYLSDHKYLSDDGMKINEQIQQMDDNTAFDIINLLNATQLFTQEGLQFHQSFFDNDKIHMSVSEMESALKGFVQESYMGTNHNTLKEKYHYIPLTEQSVKKYKDQGVFKHGLRRVRVNDNTKGAIYIDENHIVVAYVAVEKKINGQRWITALEVSEEYQGHDYGVDLLQIAVDDFGATYLSVNKKNKRAFHMYKKYGWNVCDEDDHVFFMKLTERTDE